MKYSTVFSWLGFVAIQLMWILPVSNWLIFDVKTMSNTQWLIFALLPCVGGFCFWRASVFEKEEQK